ncbi:titin homolog [Nilaparvata lugens]|uniref:titin homolog n=1 Tax=Nilaparvata lugens TaxID=108931 RepID=UPI00193C94EE|nr:titin homolog [Nilaparvata lugens]
MSVEMGANDTGDFFWIDPNQSFLTTVPIKSQAPKVPIVCDLDKEMTAFEESIGVTESHVSGEHSSPGNDSGFRDSKKTCADNIQVGNKTHSERKLPDVDNKMPDIDKKMPDVDKEMSDVDNKMPDIDKKMSDVDKKMPDVDKKIPDGDKKIPDGDKKISDSDKMSDVDKEDQIVQLGKLKKTDVHKMIAANLEKEDKELENLNKNLMGIIGNLMAKVQSVPTAASDGSSLALDPRNSSLASDISINPSMDPKESIPQSIDVLESSAVGPCPTAGYDDLHLLDPQDRPHYNVETGILQPQFNEHVIPIGDTPSFPQYPQQYYSQYPGQSHVASSDQQSFVPHGNVPIYPYSDHGSAVVNLYPGQYMYDVQPSGYDDDHSPGQYSDSEEPNSAPHVGPCTPEQQPSVEASKKPFMTDEEIRLHRKEYFRKKREEQLMKASLLGNPDHALQPSSTVSKQHHTDPRLSKPDHSRKDQKPTPSKLNQPKGTNSRYQNEPSQNTKFMIPKRNEKAQEGRQFEINPTNPFAPNPKFFMKKKSIAPSSSERNKPDTNKLDKHFYNELKSKFEFKSKSRPVCDNSISSTTDSPTKKKHLSSKFKEIRKDKKYPKNPLDSRKHEAKRKEVSSATLARRIASSDEEDPVENRNKSDNHKLLSDGAKLSLSSKSSFSHLKDTTNAIETYPFVTDAVSRKAMACKCFVKLVNIFWNEKKPITVDEMDEKLPTLVRKKLHLLRKNDSLRAIQGTKNNHEESCSVPESSCPNSSLEKENEKVIDNKQNQEHFEQRTADVAEELLSHEDKGAAQEHGMDMADTIENQQGRSVGDDSEDNEQILTEAKVKLKTSLEGQQEKSAKQMSNSTSEENPEGCRISENDKKGDIDHNSDIQISENKIEENANQTQVVDGNITIKKKPMEDLEDVPVESNTIDTPQEQKGKIPDAIEETPLKRKLIDPEDEVLVQSKKIKGTISDVSDSSSKSKIESRKTRNESQDESIKDMQHEKKRKLNDSLESAKERKTSTESKIDSSTEAREKSTREDTIDTPIESDGESIGCGAGDFSMDHDDSSDNEEIVPHLSHHDTDLEKSDKIETLNETEDLDEFSKLLVKSSETEPGKCEDQKKADGEILEKEKDTFQECRISENDEKGDIDHNSDIQISEIKIEENAEHHKKNPISSDKSSDSSTLNANELVCSKNRITYPDELSCRKCSVKLVDIFWKEKKSMIHEELEEILPTLINDMVKRYKISRKQKKLEMKHERLLEKKSDKKKKKESDSRTLITKGQKKYFRDEGEEAHSKKSKGQKKTLQEESIENLKKKSGISRELVSSSSSDSDDDFKIKKSMDSDKVSTSRDVEQNSDDDTLLNTYKDHSKNKDKSPREYNTLSLVERLASSCDPESYAGGSVTTSRATQAGQVEG